MVELVMILKVLLWLSIIRFHTVLLGLVADIVTKSIKESKTLKFKNKNFQPYLFFEFALKLVI